MRIGPCEDRAKREGDPHIVGVFRRQQDRYISPPLWCQARTIVDAAYLDRDALILLDRIEHVYVSERKKALC